MSNRDLIGSGLEQLAAGLGPFVDATMRQARGPRWLAGTERADGERFGNTRTYNLRDPRFLLRVITENRETFKPVLPRPGLSLASELRDIGNRYAHEFEPAAFDQATTSQALAAMARLLTLAGARRQAAAVTRLAPGRPYGGKSTAGGGRRRPAVPATARGGRRPASGGRGRSRGGPARAGRGARRTRPAYLVGLVAAVLVLGGAAVIALTLL